MVSAPTPPAGPVATPAPPPERVPQPDLGTLLAAHARALTDPFFDVPRVRAVEAAPACRTCALCCRVTGLRSVSPSDVARLAEHLGCTPAEVRARFLRADAPTLRSPCAFLAETAEGFTCSVHAARPSVCRAFDRCAVLQDPDAEAPDAWARADRWVAEATARLLAGPAAGAGEAAAVGARVTAVQVVGLGVRTIDLTRQPRGRGAG